MQTKTILVTGGAGFLGSHLCEKLIAYGHRVICLDNFFTGERANIAHLEDLPYFTLIEHDICMPIYLEVDEIYNLACPASPQHYQRDPIFTSRTCVIGALNMLELARQNNAKILQASTSEIYGDPTVHPQPENYSGHVNPIGPRACYDEGKRCAETLFFDFMRVHDVDIKVARIFNTYGPRMQEEDGRVVSNFIVQSLRNNPITIYGSGKQTRSFCYVDDLIDGLVRFMGSSENGPLNFGNPDEYRIVELAELIVEMTDSDSELIYEELPEDDPKLRRPKINQAKKVLQWQPEIVLAQGLERTITYFSQLKQTV